MKTEMIAKCSELFDVHPRDICGRYQFQFVVHARFAIYKAMHIRKHSYSAIGRMFERDHSTIMHGVARADYMMSRDPEFAAKVNILATLQYIPIQKDDHVEAIALEPHSAG